MKLHGCSASTFLWDRTVQNSLALLSSISFSDRSAAALILLPSRALSPHPPHPHPLPSSSFCSALSNGYHSLSFHFYLSLSYRAPTYTQCGGRNHPPLCPPPPPTVGIAMPLAPTTVRDQWKAQIRETSRGGNEFGKLQPRAGRLILGMLLALRTHLPLAIVSSSRHFAIRKTLGLVAISCRLSLAIPMKISPLSSFSFSIFSFPFNKSHLN